MSSEAVLKWHWPKMACYISSEIFDDDIIIFSKTDHQTNLGVHESLQDDQMSGLKGLRMLSYSFSCVSLAVSWTDHVAQGLALSPAFPSASDVLPCSYKEFHIRSFFRALQLGAVEHFVSVAQSFAGDGLPCFFLSE